MVKKFKNLRPQYKICTLELFVTLIAFLATFFFIFHENRADIPLGILLGGIIFSLLAFIQGKADEYDERRSGTVLSIIMIAVRFVLIVSLMIVIGFMYFKWNMPYFNLFSFIGIYSAKILITILVYVLDKPEEHD